MTTAAFPRSRETRLDESRRRSVGDGRTEGSDRGGGYRRCRFTERDDDGGRCRKHADRTEHEPSAGRTAARYAAMGSPVPMKRTFTFGMRARRAAVRCVVRGCVRGRLRNGRLGAAGRHRHCEQQPKLQHDQRECARSETTPKAVHLETHSTLKSWRNVRSSTTCALGM